LSWACQREPFGADGRKGNSFHIIPLNKPADIYAQHTSDDAENISGHQSDFGAQPPSDPAEERYAYQHENLFHFILMKEYTKLKRDT